MYSFAIAADVGLERYRNESGLRAKHSHVHGHSEMQALTWQTRSEADAVETSPARLWIWREQRESPSHTGQSDRILLPLSEPQGPHVIRDYYL